MPAAFTSISNLPNSFFAIDTAFLHCLTSDKSVFTKITLQPVSLLIFSATSMPLFSFLPMVTIPAAPLSAKHRAIAAPSPCVPPVTKANFPSILFI